MLVLNVVDVRQARSSAHLVHVNMQQSMLQFKEPDRFAGETLTVIVNTFKRLDLLKNSVQHYSSCPVVSRVHVNWAESTTPPDVDQCQCCGTAVTFALPLLTHNDSSLNTRFLPIPGVLLRLAPGHISPEVVGC